MENSETNQNIAYIFWSCKELIEAKKIIRHLLDSRIIACASIFPEVASIYYWEGKVQEGKEVKVILKTTPYHFEAIQKIIKNLGSYEVPEITQVDIQRANPDYVSWLVKECSSHF